MQGGAAHTPGEESGSLQRSHSHPLIPVGLLRASAGLRCDAVGAASTSSAQRFIVSDNVCIITRALFARSPREYKGATGGNAGAGRAGLAAYRWGGAAPKGAAGWRRPASFD